MEKENLPTLVTTFGVIECNPLKNDRCFFYFKNNQDTSSADHCFMYDGDTLLFLEILEKCFWIAATFQPSSYSDHDVIFSKRLHTYKPHSLVAYKLVLQVEAYQQQPHIYLRRFWYDRNLEADELLGTTTETFSSTNTDKSIKYPFPDCVKNGGTWKPSQRHYRFSVDQDQFHSIAKFIMKQLNPRLVDLLTT